MLQCCWHKTLVIANHNIDRPSILLQNSVFIAQGHNQVGLRQKQTR